MAKSQLKQLKERLRSNGFTGQTNVKKQQKKRVPALARSAKDELLRSIREEFNPFDIKTTRQKHGDILGRKVQGAVGKPGISKQIGEDNRKRTLQKELERKNKVGMVIDRRFGENNPNMTPEERMLERFTRERQSRSSRSSSLFNLEDENEEYGQEEGLTHLGQSLSLDDEQPLMPVRKRDIIDDEDEAGLEHKKSKNEVMKEIIAKSKMYKYERQRTKEDDLEKIEELDNEIDDLRSLLSSTTSTEQRKTMDLTAKDIEYDANVREMTFDRRAKPADRTKTEQELIVEHEEKIRLLEQQRSRRMRGEESEEEADLDLRLPNKKKKPDADDLEDDFAPDSDDAADFGLGKNLGEEESGDEREPEIETDFITPIVTELQTGSVEEAAIDVDCPSSYADLSILFGDSSFPDQILTIRSIQKRFSPNLRAGNKVKLAKFSPLLLEHACAIADSPKQISDDSFNALTGLIYKVTADFPEEMASAFRARLLTIRKRMDESFTDEQSKYPLPSDGLVFILIGTIFPTSDHFHLVVTPAMLLIGQHLAMASIKSIGDFVYSSLLARLSFKFQQLSKRIFPESLNYLNQSIASFLVDLSNLPQGFPMRDSPRRISFKGPSIEIPDFRTKLLLSDILIDRPLSLISTQQEKQLVLSIFRADLETLSNLASLWKGKDSYREMFEPSLDLLESLQEQISASKKLELALVPSIRQDLVTATESLRRLINLQTLSRKPLSLQQHKPIPIPTYLPKFEENYSVDKKSYDPNVSRQEISKLKAQIKKERKGALRDLRKDNAFISREKLAAKKKKDADYHAMLARLERSVGNEN
ncbi:nucleolar protein 14 [Lipomyces oligophaga]|uniref:nucleolar protein 14 n=1 Tax=Lipomyces oligophaga TaxID=45792 RepID=UPI0034CD3573